MRHNLCGGKEAASQLRPQECIFMDYCRKSQPQECVIKMLGKSLAEEGRNGGPFRGIVISAVWPLAIEFLVIRPSLPMAKVAIP